MPDTHALLVALIATHRPLFRSLRPDEVRTGATGPLTTCSAGDWTEHPDPTRHPRHTHAHHLADQLIAAGIRGPAEHEPDPWATPTPPGAKYGRCPWCRADVDTLEQLDAGPYLTPCWHLVAVEASDDERGPAYRLTRAAALDGVDPG